MNCKGCRKPLTARQEKLNAGLCDSCLQAALKAEARRIAKEREKT